MSELVMARDAEEAKLWKNLTWSHKRVLDELLHTLHRLVKEVGSEEPYRIVMSQINRNLNNS